MKIKRSDIKPSDAVCANCKHWREMSDDWGYCEKFKDDGRPPIDGMAETDAQGCDASISTGAAFGCNAFKAS